MSFCYLSLIIEVSFSSLFLVQLAQCGFRETPASVTEELNSRITLTCSYFEEIKLNMRENIVIEWLKSEPRLVNTGTDRKPEFKRFYGDMRRVFIRYSRSESENIVVNTSTIEFIEAKYEDMGEYKCLINGGLTFGGAESLSAKLQLIPRIFIDPKIALLDKDKERIGLFCNVSWLEWTHNSFTSWNAFDSFGLSDNECRGPQIVWYATHNGEWVNPDDPTAMERAYDNRRPASHISNVVVENGGRRLWINTEPEGSNYEYISNKKRRERWSYGFDEGDDEFITDLERDLIKISGIFWCEFQYCYDKEILYERRHAVVKFPIRFERYQMERRITGFVGEDIELNCVVAGGPYYTIKWGKGNRTLSLSRNEPRSMRREDELRYFDYQFNSTTGQATKLILRGLQYSDRAEYFCNATSFDGTEITASYMLKVKDKFNAYIPLGVVVIQVILIILLIFITEKFFVKDPHKLHKHTEKFSVTQAMELTGSRRTLSNEDRRQSMIVENQNAADRTRASYHSLANPRNTSGII